MQNIDQQFQPSVNPPPADGRSNLADQNSLSDSTVPTITCGGAVAETNETAPQLPEVGHLGALPSVPVPQMIVRSLHPKLRQAVQLLCGRPPLVAGQSADQYFLLLEVTLHEWFPQNLRELSLIKQLVDSEWEILSLQQVQAWLINSAIGSELLQLLCEIEGLDGSECSVRRIRALRVVVFAALSGDPEAVKFVEERTKRKIGIGPEAAMRFEVAAPVHVIADRAVSTRIARRDAAYRELMRIKAERVGRTTGQRLTVNDIRSALPLAEYIRLLTEVDVYRAAEPAAFAAAKAGAPEMVSARAPTKETAPSEMVSVHAPTKKAAPPETQQ